MKYHIITYGCQMNKSDSERIATVLENIGYQPSSKENRVDLIVVNMCSVRQSAVDRVFGLIPKFQKLKTQNSKLKTILTGCVLKEDKQRFTKRFNLVLNIKDLPHFPKKLNVPYRSDRSDKRQWNDYLKIQPKYQSNFSAFIPISNGCNNFCSYCVVPYVRGPLICRDHKEILEEAKNVIKKGFKEIWLLGQNVNRYRSKSKIKNQKSKIINFAKLLKMVNDIPGDFSIKFTSSHPADFSDELIDVIANSKKIAKYLHLPVQSGDNEILKKMNRPYTIEQYKNLVKKIRQKIPNINLSTDVIVGFPGETKKQFQKTVKLCKEIKFDKAYIAKYSPRPGTAAAKLKDNVSPQEKKRRWQILENLINKKN